MKIKTNRLTGVELDWAVKKAIKKDGGYFLPSKDYKNISHSTNWAQGGPIIEREMITVGPAKHEGFMAWAWPKKDGFWGDSPLIAAMRCYVASKLGEEVEVHDELSV